MEYATKALATEEGQAGISSAIYSLASAIDGNGGRYLDLVNLGTSYSAELKSDISSGAFKKAVVGGFLTLNSHVYLFAHPNYFLHTGIVECTANHMVVVPLESTLVSGKMNNSNTSSGGYIGSDFKTGSNSNTALAEITNIIETDFGSANILTHKELFTNAFAGWIWSDSYIELLSEAMVYGYSPFSYSPKNETGVAKSQLELFAKRPDLITTGGNWRLRNVTDTSSFARVGDNGSANYEYASYSLGIRPYFAIC